MSPTCRASWTALLISAMCSPASADEWPQWRGPDRDGVWAETGLVEKFDGPELKLRWRVPISSGYSGPTVAGGRVYVTDRVVEPDQIERVHCFDWETGHEVWSHSYACSYEDIGYTAGPRAAVLIDDGRAYSLGAAGHLFCFDAAGGRIVWKHDLRTEYRIRMPTWGIAVSPLVEGDFLIVQIGGADDACLVAFDKKTGEERWTALADDASYSAPIIIEQAGRRVLVCWTGERVTGLDPATGKLHWSFPFKWEKWPIGIATPVAHGDLLLVSEAHKGTLLLRTGPALADKPPVAPAPDPVAPAGADQLEVEKVWHRRSSDEGGGPALHCLISTPLVRDGHIYAADHEGVLRCLDLETGEQVWEDDSAVPTQRWATIHLVENGNRVWMFNERGELIIARLSPAGFEEISRAKLIDPTTDQLRRRGGVAWSHPAFAYRHVFARNDRELVCADLSAEGAR